MTVNIKKSNSGAVSLFIVIFATLLITVVTVSFIRIMIKGQQQATATDLSQSAYDSAQAGIEDAKRVLLRYQLICKNNPDECAAAKTDIVSSTCNAAILKLKDEDIANQSAEEIKVQQNDDNGSLNQAYTCVKIIMDTSDYLGRLTVDNSKLIPLVGVDAFDTVKIEWFNSSDLTSDSLSVDLPAPGVITTPLLRQNNDDDVTSGNSWSPNRPSVLKAQLIQVSSDKEFHLSDFDENNFDDDSSANTNTYFFYPSKTGVSTFTDNHKIASNKPFPVECKDSLSAGGYACSVTLTLPSIAGTRVAFLNLSAFYNSTNYRVSLFDGVVSDGTNVKFDAIQPEIDSTGRASDLFRRVKSRVELGGIFPYPQAELELSGNLCKNFMVTNREGDYKNNCNP